MYFLQSSDKSEIAKCLQQKDIFVTISGELKKKEKIARKIVPLIKMKQTLIEKSL